MPQQQTQLGRSPSVHTGSTYASRPMLRRLSNAQIDERKHEEDSGKSAEETQNQPVITALAGHIRQAYSSAESGNDIVQERLLRDARQREGIYNPEEWAIINKTSGTRIFVQLTDVKCRALESWLQDIILPSGERPYSIEPTPVPDIPPYLQQAAEQALIQDFISRIQQQAGTFDPSMFDPEDWNQAKDKFTGELLKKIREQAKKDADAIEDHVDDELREGDWYKVLAEFIEDFATYETAFMEGPLYKRKKRLKWTYAPGSPIPNVTVVEEVIKYYERPSPFDVYPSNGAKTLQDGELCIRKRYERRDLEELRGVDGFDTETINQVLRLYPNGYRERTSYDQERADLQDRPHEYRDDDGHIEGIKYWGSIQGMKLLQWGMDKKQVPDPFKEYAVIAYMVGHYVIGARLNPHPLGHRNIYSASFRSKNDSIWGRSVPFLMRDIQSICNGIVRAICNNTAIASGPQIWQYVDLIPPESNRTDIFPMKIWPLSYEKLKAAGGAGAGVKPMEFYQPPFISGKLLELYDYFYKQASEVTGIPAYMYGSEKIGGAGSTASGLSMLMNAAGRGLRKAAGNIDRGVISPSVEEHWLTLMLTRPDLARGDTKIVARASEYLVQQEALQMRRTELLGATNNPSDLQIMGLDGRRELLRENIKSLKMNPDKIIPAREDMISSMVQQQLNDIIMRLAAELGMAPEQLMAMLQNPQQAGRSNQTSLQQAQPRALDPAGNPVAGQDVRAFN